MSNSKVTYRIHPAIGFARVGNAPEAYYLEPTAVGALPTELVERDDAGRSIVPEERTVVEFKQDGQVKRQAARFRVYRYEEGKPPREVWAENGLESVTWTVHVANKKAAWYNFSELEGDVMLGQDNTYQAQGVPLRNASSGSKATQPGPDGRPEPVAPQPGGDVTQEYDRKQRQELIIDPGPRTLHRPGGWVQLDAAGAPRNYKHVSFPPADLTPYPVTTLGAVRMTPRGELLVLGGYGNAGGPPGSNISSFAGADGWYDDISDGSVQAEIRTPDGETITLDAWVVTGAPKLAPELVNITSLADTFIDVGVRHMGLCPELYRPWPAGQAIHPLRQAGSGGPAHRRHAHDGYEYGHGGRLRRPHDLPEHARDRRVPDVHHEHERRAQASLEHDGTERAGGKHGGGSPPAHDEQGQPYGWQPDYVACWERDILPIFRAMKEYRWVANVDAMVSVATPPFDLSDLGDANRENRRNVFATFRQAQKDPWQQPELDSQHQQLLGDNGFPLMPLNSGDNSITNTLIEKFMALTPTQYYLLHQWAEGRCVSRRDHPDAGRDWTWASPLDIAAAGNVVGEPMAPGIEVTWTMRNPDLFVPGDPFRIKVQEGYAGAGLDPFRDETLAGDGCQPGDLTKRMAIPWQADFFDCSVQDVNFTTPLTNKTISGAARIPLAPTFLAYWWPAQSPFNVYSGALTAAEQMLDGNAYLGGNNLGQVFGQNVLYHRGLNSFYDSVVGWKYLGFILNTTRGPLRDTFPFFVERERSYDAFASGYQGLTPDGQLYTTQPTTVTSALDVNNQSQNVFPLQWLIGN